MPRHTLYFLGLLCMLASLIKPIYAWLSENMYSPFSICQCPPSTDNHLQHNSLVADSKNDNPCRPNVRYKDGVSSKITLPKHTFRISYFRFLHSGKTHYRISLIFLHEWLNLTVHFLTNIWFSRRLRWLTQNTHRKLACTVRMAARAKRLANSA